MNELYIAVMKVNYQRYLRCPWIWFSGIWLLIMLVLTLVLRFIELGEPTENGADGTFLLMWALCVFMFAGTFWQYAWALGNVDARGFHTDANKADRHFIGFMSALPLDRNVHFLIQLCLYCLTCIFICSVSFAVHWVVAPQAESIGLVAYGHVILLLVLIFEGSNQVIFDLPAAFKGEVRSITHPVVIRTWLRMLVIGLLLWLLRDIATLSPESTLGEAIFNYMKEFPLIIFGLFLISFFQYWRGYEFFKNVDIS